jgi:hypothetical protein
LRLTDRQRSFKSGRGFWIHRNLQQKSADMQQMRRSSQLMCWGGKLRLEHGLGLAPGGRAWPTSPVDDVKRNDGRYRLSLWAGIWRRDLWLHSTEDSRWLSG